MQLGLQNRKKTITALVGLGIGLILFTQVIRKSFAPATVTATTPPASVAATVATTAQLHKPRPSVAGNVVSESDPILHLEWLKSSERAAYEGTGRNIFRDEPEPPPVQKYIPGPVPPRVDTPVVPAGPPQPPPPPPINLKYYGYATSATQPGQPKKGFFLQNDEFFIGSEGEIVNHRYKIVRIHPASVEVQDVLTNSTQTLPLAQG